jgi:DNA polymerase III delta prime subunit
MDFPEILSDPTIQKLVTPLITGLIGIFSGWIINQLPALKHPEQRWGQVLKLAVSAVFLVVVISSGADAVNAVKSNETTAQLAGLAYIIMLFLLLGSIVTDVGRLLRKNSASASEELPEPVRQRRALIDKVKNKWLRGELHQSLYQQARIALHLEERPEYVPLQWRTRGQVQSIPAGTRIFERFVDLGEGGTLLVLGEPGAGKTTLLLELAEDLLDCCSAADLRQAVPVVLNLSSWGTRRFQTNSSQLTLKAWLIEELYTQYQVNRQLAAKWLTQEDLMLLLDGLDEVRSDQRESCVAAINQFRQDHGTTEIVVCSRTQDYEQLQQRLQFQAAVLIQPLTAPQVEAYFCQAGTALAGVQAALQQDEELRVLVSNPLFLAILSLAYPGKSAVELINLSEEKRREVLFNRYIEQMFEQRRLPEPEQEQMIQWLGILATQMGTEKEFLTSECNPEIGYAKQNTDGSID